MGEKQEAICVDLKSSIFIDADYIGELIELFCAFIIWQQFGNIIDEISEIILNSSFFPRAE